MRLTRLHARAASVLRLSAALLILAGLVAAQSGSRVGGVQAGTDGVGGIEKTAGNTPSALPAGSATGPTNTPPPGLAHLRAPVGHASTGWFNLGHSLPGSSSPVLLGLLNPESDTDSRQTLPRLEDGATGTALHTTLLVSGALPGAPALLIIGTQAANLPFRGGVLAPLPQIVLGGLAADSAGEIRLSGPLPLQLSPEAQFVVQFWLADPGAPQGLAASNALVLLAAHPR